MRTFTPVVILLAIAIAYPFYLSSLPTGNVPLIYSFPSVRSAVTILVFTTMAVGLNVVVGYCGLLDLGYVAFYAIGAYTGGLARLGPVPAGELPLRLGRHQPRRARDPHLDLAGADHRRRC